MDYKQDNIIRACMQSVQLYIYIYAHAHQRQEASTSMSDQKTSAREQQLTLAKPQDMIRPSYPRE